MAPGAEAVNLLVILAISTTEFTTAPEDTTHTSVGG
jgi:hypothetical protein